MVTLKQLQKENQRLRMIQSKANEAIKTNEVRKKLLRDNKNLARQIKHGKALNVSRKVGAAAAIVGKKTGTGIAKTGKAAFRGLQRYANFLSEQERKQKSVNRKLKTVSKSKRRKTL